MCLFLVNFASDAFAADWKRLGEKGKTFCYKPLLFVGYDRDFVKGKVQGKPFH